METLKDRIRREGENLGRGILKIDSFLNLSLIHISEPTRPY